ncbi:hypothetical protein J2S74_004605 [Evansella vedderi]|uniref:Uncharacterized protein n=1 Tax=Evansella vedderi TaxID=38282 RepID=A0ABU0A0Z7_9BACI|nr:hypothetical protein [Evansella vedderi]
MFVMRRVIAGAAEDPTGSQDGDITPKSSPQDVGCS